MENKTSRREISWSNLINLTINFMIENSLDDLTIGENISKADGNWGKISQLIFEGPFLQKNALYLSKNWERDRFGYKSTVLNIIKNKNFKKIDFNIIDIIFTKNEWSNLGKFISVDGTGRRYFKSQFHRFFALKLQQSGIKCWVKCVYNWFPNKSKDVIWKGKYICKNCHIEFNIIIPNDLNQIKVFVTWNGQIPHHFLVNSPKERITGEERVKKRNEIKAKGIQNIFSEQFFVDKMQNVSQYHTYKKMVSEFNHRYQLADNFCVDAQATKFCLNYRLKQTEERKISGYVQTISQDPFGVVLTSDIQVKIWTVIREENPVLHFDATGKIMTDLPHQKKILLFTLLAKEKKDSSNQKCDQIPIADFLTSAVDDITITGYLIKIIDLWSKYSFFKLPKIVVTDYSWASINALLKSFNNCKPIHYLDWAYKMIIEKNEKLETIMPVKVYLCSTHFLKNVIDDFVKANKKPDSLKFKRDFIFSFSFLQNSVNLNEFNKYLICIYNVCNKKKIDTRLINCLSLLRTKINSRNIDWLNNITSTEAINFDSCKKIETDTFFPEKEIESYQKNSKFTNYFNDILEKEENMIKQSILTDINYSNYQVNEYYCPNIFNIIRKRLHIMPFWSGILINKCFEEHKTRLSNNSIESWFDHLKNDILDVNKKVYRKRRCFTSELVTPLYDLIELKFEVNYKEKFNKISKIADSIKIKSNDMEMWDYKESVLKKDRQFYTRSGFGFLDDKISNEKIDDDLINDSFNFNSSFQALDELIIFDDDSCGKQIELNLKNEDNFIFFNIDWIKVTIDNVKSLIQNKWINDTVIEAFVQCLKNKYNKNIMFLNHHYATQIFNKGDLKMSVNFEFLKYDSIYGLLFLYGNHWTAFHADMKKKEFIYFNPSQESNLEKKRLFKNWIKFMKKYDFLDWTFSTVQHQSQKDNVSCGVFVCWFYKSLAENFNLNENNEIMNLKEFRQKIFNELNIGFMNFKPIIPLCHICDDLVSNSDFIKLICNHSFHSDCYRKTKFSIDNNECRICLSISTIN